MTAIDPSDVRYPWEEPGDDTSTQRTPPQDTDASGLEAAGEPSATLDPPEAPAGHEGGEMPEGSTNGMTSQRADDDQTDVLPRERPIAPKEYYAISEVCDLVDLKPHVLRYWETQFAVLNPSKNRSGNRVYQRKEIKLIHLVKHLLYEEKYTVEGAKQKLEQLRRGGELGAATARALDAGTLDMLRMEMHRLAEILVVPEPD